MCRTKNIWTCWEILSEHWGDQMPYVMQEEAHDIPVTYFPPQECWIWIQLRFKLIYQLEIKEHVKRNGKDFISHITFCEKNKCSKNTCDKIGKVRCHSQILVDPNSNKAKNFWDNRDSCQNSVLYIFFKCWWLYECVITIFWLCFKKSLPVKCP